MLAGLLAACGSAAKHHNLQGSITVPGNTGASRAVKSKPCISQDGYDDVKAAGQVVVKDAKGTTIGTAALSAGKFLTKGSEFGIDPATGQLIDGRRQAPCRYTFSVTDLPDAPFYSLTIGHRNPVTYKRSELASKQWHVDLMLAPG